MNPSECMAWLSARRLNYSVTRPQVSPGLGVPIGWTLIQTFLEPIDQYWIFNDADQDVTDTITLEDLKLIS